MGMCKNLTVDTREIWCKDIFAIEKSCVKDIWCREIESKKSFCHREKKLERQ